MTVSRTARPLFDGAWIVEEIKKAGIPFPPGLNLDRFFAVVCSKWTSGAEDFSQPKLDAKGGRLFKEFADAVDCFNKLGYNDFMDGDNGDFEVELFQYNRGIGRVIHSKILFP